MPISNNNKISIIMPLYNSENSIEFAIDSVLKQTYDNWELLIVDDGSTDNGGKICDDYEKRDKRIKVMHKKNGGVSSARNLALNFVSGEYIMFLDSDDWIDCDTLQHAVENIKKYDADMAIFGFSFEKERNAFKPAQWSEELSPLVMNGKELFYSFLYCKDIGGYLCNKIFKKNLIPKGFNETYHICEDFVFNAEYAENVSKAVYLPWKPYHYYRDVHGSALCRTKFDNKLLSALPAYEELIDIYRENSPKCVNTLKCNQLKCYLNFRARYILNHISDDDVKEIITNGIKKYFHEIIFSSGVSFKEKVNICLTYMLPVTALKLKARYLEKHKEEIL